jgi:hypothetical protein
MGRYDARLDYLRAKLKGAEIHETVLRKRILLCAGGPAHSRPSPSVTATWTLSRTTLFFFWLSAFHLSLEWCWCQPLGSRPHYEKRAALLDLASECLDCREGPGGHPVRGGQRSCAKTSRLITGRTSHLPSLSHPQPLSMDDMLQREQWASPGNRGRRSCRSALPVAFR